MLTLTPCNFVNIGRILTKLAPANSPVLALTMGVSFVKIRPLLTNLWDPEGDSAKASGNLNCNKTACQEGILDTSPEKFFLDIVL